MTFTIRFRLLIATPSNRNEPTLVLFICSSRFLKGHQKDQFSVKYCVMKTQQKSAFKSDV